MDSNMTRSSPTLSSDLPMSLLCSLFNLLYTDNPFISDFFLCCLRVPLRCCAAKQTSQKASIQSSQWTCAGWSKIIYIEPKCTLLHLSFSSSIYLHILRNNPSSPLDRSPRPNLLVSPLKCVPQDRKYHH